jgi:hypothetical protein
MKLSADNNANLTLSCLHRPKLAVVIIYQGRAAGRRAKYFYENLVRDLRGKYYVNPDLWNFPILAITHDSLRDYSTPPGNVTPPGKTTMMGQLEIAPLALMPPKLSSGVPGRALTMLPARACVRTASWECS